MFEDKKQNKHVCFTSWELYAVIMRKELKGGRQTNSEKVLKDGKIYFCDQFLRQNFNVWKTKSKHVYFTAWELSMP